MISNNEGSCPQGWLPFSFFEALMDSKQRTMLFKLGYVVMTPGAAALELDFIPYLVRHAAGDWGDLDAFDKQQNDLAVQQRLRILSAYNIGEDTRIWIITEADRSATTVLLPEDY
jgi:hypothetical protein